VKTIWRSSFLATAIALALFGCLVTSTAFGQTSSPAFAGKASKPDRLSTVLAGNGEVRVIVRLQSGSIDTAMQALQTPDSNRLATVAQVMRTSQSDVLSLHLGNDANKSRRWAVRQITHLPLMAMTVNATELEALAADPRIAQIYEDELSPPSLDQSVPLIGMTGGTGAYANGAEGTGTAIAILDTGVQTSHPFMAGKIVDEACFSTNVSGTSTSVCPNGANSQTGTGSGVNCSLAISGCNHGTHVAGIAAGRNASGSPASGVAREAKIMAIQVFASFSGTNCTNFGLSSPCALTYTSDQIAGLNHVLSKVGVLSQTIAAANMSLGGGSNTGTCDGDSRKSIIDALRSANVATVIASGNNGFTSSIGAPGCISTAITVGSTTKSDVISSFSNNSSVVDLLAPGSSINSSVPTSTYSSFNGTSMATPHVAGAFAAIRSRVPSATVTQIENALKNTGLTIADTRTGGTISKPRIRVDQALSSLLGGGTTPALSVTPAGNISSSGNVGGPFTPASAIYSVQNSGGGTMAWSASSSVTSVATVSPTSGSLSAGASTNVTVTFTGTSLSAGGYASTITFTNSSNGVGNTSRTANLAVNTPGGGSACADTFASAPTIPGGSGSTTGSNASATGQTGEPNHANVSLPLNSVWCKWTAPASGTTIIDTAGSGFDTTLAVYQGSAVGSLALIAQNDDPPSGGTRARVVFPAVSGQTYYIALDGYTNAVGTYSLAWNQPTSAANTILSAVLPYARSTNPGRGALTLGQIINVGTTTATDCTLGLPTGFPGTLLHQRLNPNGSLAGGQFDPASIPSGAAQGWVFQYTPTTTFSATNIPIIFDCANSAPAQVITGVNTFLVSVSPTLPPDLLMYTVTTAVPDDKILRLPGPTGTNIVGMISQNVGSAGTITVSADDNGRGLPLTTLLCQVTPQLTCAASPSPTVTLSMAANQVATFTLFVTGSGVIAPNAATNRIYIRMKDQTGETRGATALAVFTVTGTAGSGVGQNHAVLERGPAN
jgi:subtilisin family serine protease